MVWEDRAHGGVNGKNQVMRDGSPPHRLFAGKPLRVELASAARVAVDMLLGSQAEEVLNTAEADFLEPIVRLATFRMPVMHRTDAYLEPPTDIAVTRQETGRSAQPVIVTRCTLAVPVTGQLSLLTMTASGVTSPAPIYGEIDSETGIMRLHCDGLLDPAEVRACFERQLDQIETLLARTQAEVEAHNRLMAREFEAAVRERRAKLLAAQGHAAKYRLRDQAPSRRGQIRHPDSPQPRGPSTAPRW
jgi:hypothetical protein